MLHRAVHQSRLERRAVEEKPAQIGAAQRVADRRRKPGLWIQVGHVLVDGALLGDERALVNDRRDLAHRVDRQIGRLALLALLQIQHLQLEFGAELFHQDQRAGRARLRRVIERDLAIACHVGFSLGEVISRRR